jgi:chromosomal replication initiation ATPase DnaA
VTRSAVAAQLPLALVHRPDLSRDSFVAGASNRAALAMIESWPAWPAPVVALSGPAGSGKTHLAHVWAERAGAGILDADALFAWRSLDLPASPLVVEDVDPDGVPEQTLFHLINAAREAGRPLLFTSRRPAAEWRIELADLRSRLRLAAPLVLAPPDDDLLRAVLAKLFADRQLLVAPAVLDYLVARMERSLGFAAQLVATLDREALASGRRIARPMAAAVLARLAEARTDVHDFE